ncbi:hypothetical protein [Microbulbifer taiwanensis]|uniref:hypothetical protein n=1 Tax=Microbulbifer taiwanensis TaxID=986746 RepID=UPI003616C344
MDAVLETVGKRIVLGLPLGVGKANHFANALYARAAADASISLTIFTALTLERPIGYGEIGRRFVQPLLDRLYNRYQDLGYTPARRRGCCRTISRCANFSCSPAPTWTMPTHSRIT